MTLPTTNLIKNKMDLVVKNRKAELYLDELRENYYLPLIEDYENCIKCIKKTIKIRKYPWYLHVIPQTAAFIIDPIGYIKLKWQGYKFLIDSYWQLKQLVLECKLEFEATEKCITEAKEIINNIQKEIDDKVE